jgi:hypothetical protein
MPWKECHVMDERLRLVARLLEGEKMGRRGYWRCTVIICLACRALSDT